jgi:hypothetical protein
MKKIFVIALALCLAIPAMSYAGSASSRWDLTIGGTVKFDMGWTDYSTTSNIGAGGLPTREAKTETAATKYGQQIWGVGQTSLMFAVKGPDTFGAKTSAFVLGDFVGFFGTSSTYAGNGGFSLMFATMNFDWKDTSLMMGQGGSIFGSLPTWSENIGWSTLPYGGKGAAPVVPQITVTQRFSKNLNVKFGIASGEQFVQKNTAPFAGNATQRGWMPMLQGQIAYNSDACGKIGPWNLQVAASGAYGQDKYVEEDAPFVDDTIDKWFAEVKWIVPIIPEKKGNKAGALYYAGSLWTAQNMGGFYGGLGGGLKGAYVRDGEYKAAVVTGSFNHVAFYLTDSLYLNGMYYYTKQNQSRQNAVNSNIDVTQGVIATIAYNASPAVKIVGQWDKEWSKYVLKNVAGLKDDSSHNAYRISAMYYF